MREVEEARLRVDEPKAALAVARAIEPPPTPAPIARVESAGAATSEPRERPRARRRDDEDDDEWGLMVVDGPSFEPAPEAPPPDARSLAAKTANQELIERVDRCQAARFELASISSKIYHHRRIGQRTDRPVKRYTSAEWARMTLAERATIDHDDISYEPEELDGSGGAVAELEKKRVELAAFVAACPTSWTIYRTE